jgi:hypothetical protein
MKSWKRWGYRREADSSSALTLNALIPLMKAATAKTLRDFSIELAIYALLVVAYFFLVLHFLGGWLQQLEIHHRNTYGGVAILLIIGQAVLLENVTTFLLWLIRGRSE